MASWVRAGGVPLGPYTRLLAGREPGQRRCGPGAGSGEARTAVPQHQVEGQSRPPRRATEGPKLGREMAAGPATNERLWRRRAGAETCR